MIRARLVAEALAILLAVPALAQEPPAQPPAPAPAPAAAAAAAPAPAPGTERASRILGTVILSRRNPVVGATVLLTSLDPPRRVWVTSTDDKGEFRMEAVPEGSYRLEARRSDLVSVVRDKIALRPPFRAVIELTMAPSPGGVTAEATAAPGPEGGAALEVTGRTVDRMGNAIPDAKLRWVDAAGRRDPATLRSGGDGTFSMQGLPAGTWRVEVFGIGFLPVRVDLPVSENTAVTAVLVKQSASHEPLPMDLMPPEEPIPPPEPKPAAVGIAPTPTRGGN